MNQQEIDAIIYSIRNLTYICSMCGYIVFPSVNVLFNEVEVTQDKSDIRGGKGNKIIYNNVCNECRNKLTLFK